MNSKQKPARMRCRVASGRVNLLYMCAPQFLSLSPCVCVCIISNAVQISAKHSTITIRNVSMPEMEFVKSNEFLSRSFVRPNGRGKYGWMWCGGESGSTLPIVVVVVRSWFWWACYFLEFNLVKLQMDMGAVCPVPGQLRIRRPRYLWVNCSKMHLFNWHVRERARTFVTLLRLL